MPTVPNAPSAPATLPEPPAGVPLAPCPQPRSRAFPAALVGLVGAALVMGALILWAGPATLAGLPFVGGRGIGGIGISAGLPEGRGALADAGGLRAGAGAPVGVCTAGSRNAFGESLTIAAEEHVCGDASVYGGKMTVLGQVDGNVTAVGGDVTIYGDVGGDVRAVGGSVYLEDGARVLGNVHALGGTVVRGKDAVVAGNIQHDTMDHDIAPLRWFGFSNSYAFPWMTILFWTLAAAGLTHFFPEAVGRVRAIARSDFPRSLVMGGVTFIVGALLSVVLIATCLGIPVALLVLGAMWLAWVVGTVALGLLLGERLLHSLAPGMHSPVAGAVLGVAALALTESVPCLGGVISLVAGCAGLGAAMLAALHARRPPYRHIRMAYRGG